MNPRVDRVLELFIPEIEKESIFARHIVEEHVRARQLEVNINPNVLTVANLSNHNIVMGLTSSLEMALLVGDRESNISGIINKLSSKTDSLFIPYAESLLNGSTSAESVLTKLTNHKQGLDIVMKVNSLMDDKEQPLCLCLLHTAHVALSFLDGLKRAVTNNDMQTFLRQKIGHEVLQSLFAKHANDADNVIPKDKRSFGYMSAETIYILMKQMQLTCLKQLQGFINVMMNNLDAISKAVYKDHKDVLKNFENVLQAYPRVCGKDTDMFLHHVQQADKTSITQPLQYLRDKIAEHIKNVNKEINDVEQFFSGKAAAGAQLRSLRRRRRGSRPTSRRSSAPRRKTKRTSRLRR